MRNSSGEKQEEILAIDRKVIEENGLDAEYRWPVFLLSKKYGVSRKNRT